MKKYHFSEFTVRSLFHDMLLWEHDTIFGINDLNFSAIVGELMSMEGVKFTSEITLRLKRDGLTKVLWMGNYYIQFLKVTTKDKTGYETSELQMIVVDIESKEISVLSAKTLDEKFEETNLSKMELNSRVELDSEGSYWEGGVLDGYPCGYGKEYDGENNLVYEGFMFNGVPVCYGKEYCERGGEMKLVYEGSYAQGFRYGFAKLYNANGEIEYEGEWMDDQPIDKIHREWDRVRVVVMGGGIEEVCGDDTSRNENGDDASCNESGDDEDSSDNSFSESTLLTVDENGKIVRKYKKDGKDGNGDQNQNGGNGGNTNVNQSSVTGDIINENDGNNGNVDENNQNGESNGNDGNDQNDQNDQNGNKIELNEDSYIIHYEIPINEFIFPRCIEELVIGKDLYKNNDMEYVSFHSMFTRLKRIFICSNSFVDCSELTIIGLPVLESVKFGTKCFNHLGGGLYIEDCPNLCELDIGYHSFDAYSTCSICNVNSLRSIKFDGCFNYECDMILQGMWKFNSIR